jgi:hypothetical protein
MLRINSIAWRDELHSKGTKTYNQEYPMTQGPHNAWRQFNTLGAEIQTNVHFPYMCQRIKENCDHYEILV